MTTCRKLEDALWEAAGGGEMSPELAEHLRACGRCARALGTLDSAQRGLRALCEVDAPKVTHAALARAADRRERRHRTAVALVGLACCLLAALPLIARQAAVSRATGAGATIVRRQPPVNHVVKATSDHQAPAGNSQQAKAPDEVQKPATATQPAKRRAATPAAPRPKPEPKPEAAPPANGGDDDSDPPATPTPDLDAPCHQVTLIVARPPWSPRSLPVFVADPTYRALPQPEMPVQPEALPALPFPVLDM